MIRVLPYGCQFPRADKGSVIRQAFYKQFANEIEEAYDAAAASTTDRKVFTGQDGQEEKQETLAEQIDALVSRYASFHPVEKKRRIALTGATGSLGAHVLAQLVSRADVEVVYCLVRACNNTDASNRIEKFLVQRKIYNTLALSKMRALATDLASPRLGLDEATYKDMASSLTGVIHCAWSVNFNKRLVSFQDCISGLHHLIALCLATSSSSRAPATFDFCSSASTVARCLGLHTPEQLAEYDWAQDMGYAQSKCVL
ncbi:putative secondary metabolism biosynthetic enzyme [Exserohilum turcicum]